MGARLWLRDTIHMNDSLAPWLHDLRAVEVELLLARYRSSIVDKRLLEIGSGTGFQLRELRKHCRQCIGVDLQSSVALTSRVADVLVYDGRNLPFRDASFDVVYSSNVLEHVDDLFDLLSECRRVLRPGGRAIHVVPSHWWKIWTLLTHWPAGSMRALQRFGAFAHHTRSVARSGPSSCTDSVTRAFNFANFAFPPRHGERGNRITEFYYFHPAWWRREFSEAGWRILDETPIRILYSGNSFFRGSIPISTRRHLARYFGSASSAFMMEWGAGEAPVAERATDRNRDNLA